MLLKGQEPDDVGNSTLIDVLCGQDKIEKTVYFLHVIV
jgi:hypothetical protein